MLPTVTGQALVLDPFWHHLADQNLMHFQGQLSSVLAATPLPPPCIRELPPPAARLPPSFLLNVAPGAAGQSREGLAQWHGSILPEAPRAVARGAQAAELEWAVLADSSTVVVECIVEAVIFTAGDMVEEVKGICCVPRLCLHSGRWRADVENLQADGAAYRFRAVARTGAGWAPPGAWSPIFRTPRLPLPPGILHAGWLRPEPEESGDLVHVIWRVDPLEASDGVGALGAEDVSECEVQLRISASSSDGAAARGAWAACGAGPWGEPEPCRLHAPCRLLERGPGAGAWQTWECLAHLPLEVEDEVGRRRAVRGQFRCRARSMAGWGAWGAWSVPLSRQKLNDRGLRYGWGAHR